MITEMSIRFLAYGTSEVNAEARVIKPGRSLCPVSVDPSDVNRSRIADAQVTGIFSGPSKPTAKQNETHNFPYNLGGMCQLCAPGNRLLNRFPDSRIRPGSC
jgi:hypothetical protein